jgi:DNA mismatch repair protein MSH3
MIEVGYKYRFFGEDAKVSAFIPELMKSEDAYQVAAKELGMVCFLDRNLLVASIPVHRRDIHLKRCANTLMATR